MITGDKTIPASTKNILFGRTTVDWDKQKVIIPFGDETYEHKMTQTDWNYLKTGMEKLMKKAPKISNVVFPAFDPNL